MRKRRIDAKTRVIARAYLSGEKNAVETCWLLSPRLYWDQGLVSKDDYKFVKQVVKTTSHLPIGEFQENWHPDFLPVKLKELAVFDERYKDGTRIVCQSILDRMALRKLMKKNENHQNF
jgi:hypothetical protein